MPSTVSRPGTELAAFVDVVGPKRGLRIAKRELWSIIRLWVERSEQRVALRELVDRSDGDHLLDDIGVTPREARRGSAKWFWQP